jgi:hypothetical protein
MTFFECVISACGMESCPFQEVGTQCATGLRTRGESNITTGNVLVSQQNKSIWVAYVVRIVSRGYSAPCQR